MSGCVVWPNGVPCGMPVVETLVYLNPLCAGRGDLPVCAMHLREHCVGALLVEDRA